MSSTRRADGTGPLRQERFASSQEFERGLMANLVAKRCSVIERAEDRALVWFLQLLSHEVGLKNLASELREHFADRLATLAMRRIGMKPGQIYNASQVKQARDGIRERDYPLRGEARDVNELDLTWLLSDETKIKEKRAQLRYEALFYPTNYPASDFVDHFRDHAKQNLEKHLQSLCLDPALAIEDGSPWYFPTLISTLREYQAQWIAARRPLAVTSIGDKVCSALDYARETRRLVLIDGPPRIGKSFSARAWCETNPGCARYVQCPSTNDDFSFFRAIALSLGVSINLKSKAQELRNRIEETLQHGDLALVIDEAHYLWPQSHYRNTMPGRVNWLLTALVNNGIPVSLVTTPQFFRSQKAIEEASCWTSEQFTGRIGHYEKLPDSLSGADLKAVASALVPGADARSIEALVLYAQSSAKYLAGIDATATRARFIARKEGREQIEFRDVKRAIKESVIPSDASFARAMNVPANPSRKRPSRAFAAPLQNDFPRSETALPAQRDSQPNTEPRARFSTNIENAATV